MQIDIPRVNNFWIDNGIVVLGRWLWEAGYKPRLEATKLMVDLTEKEFEKIVDNQIRERYLKQKQLRVLQPFIKQYTTAEPWKKSIFSGKKKSKLTCSFCGRFTSDEKHLTLGRAIFPLTNTRFPAFRSNRTEFSYICPICYVLGRLAPFNTFFCSSGTNYFYFIPYSLNLGVLSEIKPLLEKMEERSNYTNRLAEGRKGFYHTDKFYEEILGVLYYCFLELNKMGKIDIFKSLNEFYCFQYDGMLIVDFLRFEKTKELYELFSKLIPKIEARSLSKVFNYFYAEDDEYLRNEFCKHLLEFSHISVVQGITKILFHKVKNGTYFPFPIDLDTFLDIYYCEVMKAVEEEIKELCKSIGEGIGLFASGSYEGGKERKDIIYNLRNSDTIQKFVNVLNSVMIEEFSITKGEIVEKLLDNLDKRNWETIREFTLAYALNKYLRIKTAQKLSGG